MFLKGVRMSSKFGAFEQNQVIDKARKRRLPVQIFLKNGAIIKGKIIRFDLFSLLLKSEEEHIVVFKHAISTLLPLKKKKKKKARETQKKKISEKDGKIVNKKIRIIKKRKND